MILWSYSPTDKPIKLLDDISWTQTLPSMMISELLQDIEVSTTVRVSMTHVAGTLLSLTNYILGELNGKCTT